MMTADEFKAKITFEEKEASPQNSMAAEFFTRYIKLMDLTKEGMWVAMFEGGVARLSSSRKQSYNQAVHSRELIVCIKTRTIFYL